MLAQQPAPVAVANTRHVFVPCQFTSTSIGLSGEESPQKGRGFSIHVANDTNHDISLPSNLEFGWRVETLEKHGWKVKAQGGPVHRTSTHDEDMHMAVTGETGSGAMMAIHPNGARDVDFYLPAADAALHSERMLTDFRVSLFWAPSPNLQAEPGIPPCALTASFTMKLEHPQ
jgi:hypothetical protein